MFAKCYICEHYIIRKNIVLTKISKYAVTSRIFLALVHVLEARWGCANIAQKPTLTQKLKPYACAILV